MTTERNNAFTETALKMAKATAIAAGVKAEHVEDDMRNWLNCRKEFTLEEISLYLAQYILTAQPIPRPEFRMSYSEYANLTSFLPSKGGRGTVVALKRNENNDLLFALEGDTNITRFGQPEE